MPVLKEETEVRIDQGFAVAKGVIQQKVRFIRANRNHNIEFRGNHDYPYIDATMVPGANLTPRSNNSLNSTNYLLFWRFSKTPGQLIGITIKNKEGKYLTLKSRKPKRLILNH